MKCNNCPQYNRVCKGERNENKLYCFFHHGNREIQYRQFDDLMELVRYCIDEANSWGDWINKEKFTIEDYGAGQDDGYYILLLYPKNESDGKVYPVGYIKYK